MKIKLNLDTLSVDSFETDDVAELGRGTVPARRLQNLFRQRGRSPRGRGRHDRAPIRQILTVGAPGMGASGETVHAPSSE